MCVKERLAWILFLTGLTTVISYPTGKAEAMPKQTEKHYPNGTVVGKYAYVDKDGNPIEVKYYADDASYGVELKSMKILGPSDVANSTNDIAEEQDSKKELMEVVDKENEDNLSMDSPINTKNEVYDGKNRIHKRRNSYGSKNSIKNNKKERSGMNLYTTKTHNPDFEVFYQNDIKDQNCGKEKVHVYFDKDRKIRNALSDYEVAQKYCEQFG